MSVEYIFVFPFEMRHTQRGMQGHRQQDEIFTCSNLKKKKYDTAKILRSQNL